MSHLMRAGDLVGLPVVSIVTGEDIAEVRDVVYDAEHHRLAGFTLNKRGFFAGRMKDILAAESLAAIGADAVMVADDEAVAAAGEGALARTDEAASVIGNRVLSADGNELGEITDVIVATGSKCRAVGYQIDSKDGSESMFVPISAQIGLSDDNLLLPEEATDLIRNDLAGFGAAVESYPSLPTGGENQ